MSKLKVLFAFFILLSGVAFGAVLNVAQAANVLANPGFESGTSSWDFYTSGAGLFAATGPATEGSNAARIQINSPGTNVQLNQTNVALVAGKQYRLTFDAYSNTGHDMSVSLFKNTDPWTSYGLFDVTVNLGTSWSSFSSDFTAPVSASDGRFMFWFADYDEAGDIFWIDNISLAEIGAPSDTQAPSVPANLSASAVSSSQINLSWTASTDNVGVAGYKIFQGGTQIGTSPANSYSDFGLMPSTSYSYTVSAYDAEGNNSAQSSAASATTPSQPPLSEIKRAYYSVGQNINDHKTGSPTVTIVNGVATFSVAQTADNMGVGDRVTYNGSTRAFISGKISQTQWYVVTVTGETPADTANKTVNSIRHEFASLNDAVSYYEGSKYGDSNHLGSSNLVANNVVLNIPCYYDTSPEYFNGGGLYAGILLSNYNLIIDSEHYIRIYTPNNTETEVNRSQRHEGKWDNQKYSLIFTPDNNGTSAIRIYVPYVKIDGLQIEVISNYEDNSGIEVSYTQQGWEEISNNIIKAQIADYGFGIKAGYQNKTGELKIYNNLIYDFVGYLPLSEGGYGTSAGIWIDNCYEGAPCGSAYIYNNTIVNTPMGIDNSNGTVFAKNNIVQDAGGGRYDWGVCYGGYGVYDASSGYNICNLNETRGSNSKANTTVSFLDKYGKDFHLSASDTAARDAGINLSGDPYLPFSEDINNYGRPYNYSWDIGAEEFSMPQISLNPATFNFSGTSGQEAPVGQSLNISNTGSGMLNFNVSTNQDWCHTNPTSGSLNIGLSQDINVFVDAPSNAGTFYCEVSVSDPSAGNSPQTAQVTYTVEASMNPTTCEAGSSFPGYSYKKSVSVVHSKVSGSGNLTDFPILVSITDADLKTVSNGGKVQSLSGYDIIFTDSDGTTKLNHEVEKYQASTGELAAWVKIPSLPSASDKIIYAYYGNSGVSSSQENKNGVWDGNFKGVWHLPNGTTLSANDSTSNNVNGTLTSPSAAVGKIDGAANFDGSSRRINLGTPSALDMSNAYTVSAWVKLNSTPNTCAGRIYYNGGQGDDPYVEYGLGYVGNDCSGTGPRFRFEQNSGGAIKYFDSTVNLSADTWYYVTGTWDSSAMRLYINGDENNSLLSVTGAVSELNNQASIGYQEDSGGDIWFFDGVIDDVRISNTARSADWIKTAYNNQSNPSSFIILGQEAACESVSSSFSLSPVAMNFEGISGGTTPADKTLSITNTGEALVNWKAETDQNWCRVNGVNNSGFIEGSIPVSGSAEITVSVDAPSNVGVYNCSVTVSDPSAQNSPQTLAVAYTVSPRLIFAKTGLGGGSISRSPLGQSCGTNCYSYNVGTEVSLSADPDSNSKVSWYVSVPSYIVSGCGDENTSCIVSINSDLIVNAAFALNPPPPPQNLRAENSTCERINLSWDDISNETGYKIYKDGNLAAQVNANTETYTANPGDANPHAYSVVSTNWGEDSAPAYPPIPENSIAAVPCQANLTSSAKTITKVNGIAYNPSSTELKLGDTVEFVITLSNTGNSEAGELIISDSFINLKAPDTGIKAKYSTQPTASDIVPGTGSGTYSISGDEPNQSIIFDLSGGEFSVPPASGDPLMAGIRTLTFEAVIAMPSNFGGSNTRMQNSALILYNNGLTTAQKTVYTPLLIFKAGAVFPIIKEVP